MPDVSKTNRPATDRREIRVFISSNFVVLLGERYGWRPLPARIETLELEKILSVALENEWRRLMWNEHQLGSNSWYPSRPDSSEPSENRPSCDPNRPVSKTQ